MSLPIFVYARSVPSEISIVCKQFALSDNNFHRKCDAMKFNVQLIFREFFFLPRIKGNQFKNNFMAENFNFGNV